MRIRNKTRKGLNPLLSLCCWTVLFLLSVTFAFGDQWYNDYDNAVKAVKKKKWNEAVGYVEAALKSLDEPRLEARTTGVRFVDYLPYYYLGFALYRLERFKEAEAAFDKSLVYGAVKDKKMAFESLLHMKAECRKKLAALSAEKRAGTVSPEQRVTTKQAEPAQKVKVATLINDHIHKGDNFWKVKNISAAKKEYNKASELIKHWGEAASRLKEVEDKLAAIRAVEKKQNIASAMERAKTAFKEGRYDDAERLLHWVLAEEPSNKTADSLMVRIGSARNTAQKKDERATAATSQPERAKAVKPAKEKDEEKDEEKADDIYAKGIGELNEGIGLYFISRHWVCETHLRNAVKLLTGKKDARELLVKAYQFLAVVLIEKHYLGDDANGKALEEGKAYIDKIYSLSPDFQLERMYFSPKVVGHFVRDAK